MDVTASGQLVTDHHGQELPPRLPYPIAWHNFSSESLLEIGISRGGPHNPRSTQLPHVRQVAGDSGIR
jgi:hypothetical protein